MHPSAREQWTMAARANSKGVLKAGEVSCPVALYTAASTAERIAFHILHRKTGQARPIASIGRPEGARRGSGVDC
jgi:non-homologous end joining protein Ku